MFIPVSTVQWSMPAAAATLTGQCSVYKSPLFVCGCVAVLEITASHSVYNPIPWSCRQLWTVTRRILTGSVREGELLPTGVR